VDGFNSTSMKTMNLGSNGPDGTEPEASRDDYSFLNPPMEGGELGWLLHYKVVRKLGEGGMGIVFEALDSHLRRPVALKVLQPRIADDPSSRDRFLREARAMAALTHDNVATIYQVGNCEGANGQTVAFLAMQYLEGSTLEALIIERGRMAWTVAARVGLETARGLAAAHARGMIHRDIKPANIWLEAPAGRVKILDFGLARLSSQASQLSATGQIIGTPSFMAPEQAAGGPIDARADLFSLGCVLYTMLTAELPFAGESIIEVLTKLTGHNPFPILDLVPDASPGLVAVVDSLLSKLPDGRPSSAKDVERLLAPFAGPEGCAALPPGVPTASPHTPTPYLAQGKTLVGSKTDAHTNRRETASRKSRLLDRRLFLAGAGVAAGAGLGYWFFGSRSVGPASAENSILVGVLHSQTGTLRNSEVPVIEMTQVALDRINEKGGLLGRPVKYIIRDAASDERIAAREAERLIVQDGVDAIFGCWTSACRKAVKSVVEQHDNLLFYPVQYEGLEQSQHIVYTGATPHQQLAPAIDWFLRRKPGARFYMVGSDYIFPRCANAIMRHRIDDKKGAVVGESYLPLGTFDTGDLVKQIKKAEPDCILNTINGSTNQAFFTELRKLGVEPIDIPTISFSLDEQVLRELPPKVFAGDYSAWSYFASIDSARNREFIQNYRQSKGDANAVTDPMEAAWIAVQFWAQAVAECRSSRPVEVRRAVLGQKLNAPEGDRLLVDSNNQHTWKYFRLGQITSDGTFKIIFEHDAPISPSPFPRYRTQEQWQKFEDDLYRQWGNRWSRASE